MTGDALSYEERSVLDRRSWRVDEQNLVFQHRNLWGTLTSELVIPLSELRPETSRSWSSDSDRQKVVFWAVLALYAASGGAGIALPSQFSWTLVRWVMVGTLVAAAVYLGVFAKRIEYALIYYRSGGAAASIGCQGPNVVSFAPFVASLQARLKASAQPSVPSSQVEQG